MKKLKSVDQEGQFNQLIGICTTNFVVKKNLTIFRHQ